MHVVVLGLAGLGFRLVAGVGFVPQPTYPTNITLLMTSFVCLQ